MPEMPEVETIARKLRRTIVGKSIMEVWLSGKPLRRPVDPILAQRLVGRIIHRIHRRGKFIVAELEPKLFWVMHLGMSGRIFCYETPAERPKHTHAVIRFADSLPHLAWFTNPEGHVEWFNERWDRYTGSTRTGHTFSSAVWVTGS